MSDGSNCSVHERCIWEITLEGAKNNADLAIRKLWATESELSRYRAAVKVMRDGLTCYMKAPIHHDCPESNPTPIEECFQCRGDRVLEEALVEADRILKGDKT